MLRLPLAFLALRVGDRQRLLLMDALNWALQRTVARILISRISRQIRLSPINFFLLELACKWAYIRTKGTTASELLIFITSCHVIVYLVDFAICGSKGIVVIFLNITIILLILSLPLNLISVLRLIARRGLGSVVAHIYPIIRLVKLLVLLSFETPISPAKVAGTHANARDPGLSRHTLSDVELDTVSALQIRLIGALGLVLGLLDAPQVTSFSLFQFILIFEGLLFQYPVLFLEQCLLFLEALNLLLQALILFIF